eukprot:CAMPEP_0171755672 /NCGR_PEP_ID=MMETSP0991-20121206/44601_1 /TAXON_ID=483369 /ORGANISM="non described non described, Strain CCMP2098" /LENGTH=234 /DNA_ID=CAMNT_0012357791 /DNA_START=54 /DNA_END=758 /DNA_ORIENTATION=-
MAAASSSNKQKKKDKNLVEAIDDALTVPVLQLGDEVPDFTADSTMGLFNLHEITFMFGFDPVATTELGMLSKLKEEFAARECKLVALCIDTKENHRKWVEDTQELQDCEVWFPIVADHNAEISRLLNLVRPKAVNAKRNLRPATLTLCVDIDRRVRFLQQYPVSTGRNFYEALRVLDTLQLTLFHQVVTPANWQQGEEVCVHPGLSSAAAGPLFSKGFNELRPWYRPTMQPDTD